MIQTCGINVREKSLWIMSEVIDILARSEGRFRGRTAFEVSGEWFTERQFTYYAEKLIAAGLVEKRVKSRGWYTWTLYRLKVNKMDAYTMLTGLPF